MGSIPLVDALRTDVAQLLRDGSSHEALHVEEAATLILRQAAIIEQMRNDVHTCHAGCTKAGCVNGRLRKEVESLRADAARLDSQAIKFSDRDEFGEECTRLIVGIDLRSAIDAAIKGTP